MRKNFKKNICCLILACLVFNLFFLSCSTKKDKKSKYKLKTDSMAIKKDNIILKGVNFYNTDSGKLLWELNSKIAKINKKKNIANLENVLIKFKKENLRITSCYGTYNLTTKDGTMYDNVTLLTSIWKINTQKVLFKNKKRVVNIQSDFKLTGKNFFLKGKGMKLFVNKKKCLIKGRVKSIWKEE